MSARTIAARNGSRPHESLVAAILVDRRRGLRGHDLRLPPRAADAALGSRRGSARGDRSRDGGERRLRRAPLLRRAVSRQANSLLCGSSRFVEIVRHERGSRPAAGVPVCALGMPDDRGSGTTNVRRRDRRLRGARFADAGAPRRSRAITGPRRRACPLDQPAGALLLGAGTGQRRGSSLAVGCRRECLRGLGAAHEGADRHCRHLRRDRPLRDSDPQPIARTCFARHRRPSGWRNFGLPVVSQNGVRQSWLLVLLFRRAALHGLHVRRTAARSSSLELLPGTGARRRHALAALRHRQRAAALARRPAIAHKAEPRCCSPAGLSAASCS